MSATNSMHSTIFRAEDHYEILLTQWERDVSIEGDKATAAQRIREVIRNHLKNLDLLGLGLTQLPPLSALGELKVLNAMSNKLTSLPEDIDSLKELDNLLLSDNKLSSLPKHIGSLTKLRSLFLQCNKLTALPREIGSLTELGTLALDCNDLRALPIEISKCAMLGVLLVDHNPELKEIPLTLGSTTQLTDLEINGTQIPPALAEEILRTSEIRLATGKMKNLKLAD